MKSNHAAVLIAGIIVGAFLMSGNRAAPVDKPAPVAPGPIVAKSYAEALAMSKSTGRPMFLYFGANWCLPCKAMKATTMENAQVRSTLALCVVLIVDVDADRPSTMRWRDRVAALPTYMLVGANEQVLAVATGFKDAPDMLAWLARGIPFACAG